MWMLAIVDCATLLPMCRKQRVQSARRRAFGPLQLKPEAYHNGADRCRRNG